MAVNLINFSEWVFGSNVDASDAFFSTIFKNNLKASNECKIRDINELNMIDHKFIKKSYNLSSRTSIDDLKSKIKLNYVNRTFCHKYIDWYIVKPLGNSGCDTYRTYFAVYLPNTDAIDQVKLNLVDYSKPCFSCDYLQIIDMSDGKESKLFIGGLNQPEPSCRCGEEHEWEWCLYHEDCLEIYFAECKKCGIKKKKTIGDNRSIQWNKNHGWRYNVPLTKATVNVF